MKNIWQLQHTSSESAPPSTTTSTLVPPSISEPLGGPTSSNTMTQPGEHPSTATAVAASRPIPIQMRSISFQDTPASPAASSRPPGLPAYSPRDTLAHLRQLGEGDERPESPTENGGREDRDSNLGTSQSRSLVEDFMQASRYAPPGEPGGAIDEEVEVDDEDGDPDPEHEHDESVEHYAFDDDDDDDPLVPRLAGRIASVSPRRPSFGASTDSPTVYYPPYGDPSDVPLDQLAPPASELPAYSAMLATDETRLISTVHLDESHPGAAFFTALNRGVTTTSQPAPEPRAHPPIRTGGKKLSISLTKSAERLNPGGTGPIFIRLPRLGKVEGIVHVGNVERGTKLEISILGYADTSYYVRGQYTLVDTLPLLKETKVLFPESSASEADTIPRAANSPGEASSPSPSPFRSILDSITTSRASSHASGQQASSSPAEPTAFIKPNTEYPFSLTMPSKHYLEDVELPPSTQIYQLGMQASVQYVLRVRLARKGWRLRESLAVPIIYEPRAYLSPRRLRMLTHDDPLNPGWRTIKLNGGKALKPAGPSAPGVEAAFLLPSPPILFVPFGSPPPPIPFHLHFHSSLTLPLATFSDPLESFFIVRLMRVASMRITTEREIRRTPIPCSVQIWQDGGPRVTLGNERPVGGEHGATGDGRRYSSHMHPPVVEARRPSEPIRRQSERPNTPTRRGSSFLRRRDSSAAAGAQELASSPDTTTALLERTMSSSNPLAPPPIDENQSFNLPLDATDVHLMGVVRVDERPDTHRKLIQSFVGPDISVQYVLEVAVQPRQGAIREAFGHVWGGGLVEVVLGPRPIVERNPAS